MNARPEDDAGTARPLCGGGLQPIRHDTLEITPWRNGTGRKADIAGGDGWTVAYAWLDGDSTFSDYGGHDRTITLTDGPGFALHTRDGAIALHVTQAFAPAAFDGGTPLDCRIAGAVCRVINVMTDRTKCRHAVEILDDDASRIDPPVVGHLVLAILDGAATLGTAAGEVSLARYDAVEITEPAHLVRAPGARAAVFRIVPAS